MNQLQTIAAIVKVRADEKFGTMFRSFISDADIEWIVITVLEVARETVPDVPIEGEKP